MLYSDYKAYQQGAPAGYAGWCLVAIFKFALDCNHSPSSMSGTKTPTTVTSQQQSPIDINPKATKEVVMDKRVGHIHLALGSASGHMEYLDTNFRVNWCGDAKSVLTLRDGREYHPIQFHFHTPSEHTLEGKRFPFCMHLVHQAANGDLAVVGVFFEEGEESSFLKQFWHYLPELDPHGEHLTVNNIDFDSLDITNESFYRYQGSLTTPPFTEGVEWVIVKDARTVSKAQILAFIDAIPGESNARELQPIRGAAGKMLFCC
ncbi:hypothetical protein DYB37_012441 [Aphanomyces astaci]|uniref:carbonic anhydrase n=1 Tax=Aphanomyces astaci TaxID=112090 RepID=A0A397AMA1_APHAT|nr:hypothetical protein DYB36_000597 [Aphanomyces astaci]RHY47170.1 hypothetical protein DYB34_005051 [Aphanomyces astaci]RHY56811.1 hypothetical protein DYB30_005430 [Aphanomyces astaci]RHY87674.1 hypothetical protein DYB35_001669 [Aphanomyces astaci]RHZ22003.1 hypothetical protein DYB37_012441 [Aphanomyces astaci]